ncbi:hypothetical protein Hdeb2414_s0012g00384601 [Helianthus debilis subsp. tardiflorus]
MQVIPADFVQGTIRLPKISKISFKIHVNLWDTFDVMIQKDPATMVYYIYDGWDNVVSFLPIYPDYYVVMRYIFEKKFQRTVFYLDGGEILVPKGEYKLAAVNIPQPGHGHANVPISIIEIEDTDNDDDDVESELDYAESMDGESVDVSSLLTNSDSDGVSTDRMSNEEDVEVTDSREDKKVDPDYQPIEFE